MTVHKQLRLWQRRFLALLVTCLAIGQFCILSHAADPAPSATSARTDGNPNVNGATRYAQSSEDIKTLTRYCYGFIVVVLVPFLIWEYRRVSRAKQALRAHREKYPEGSSEL